ncbi:MAG: hypothetical protein IK086_06400, partial [Clostridia bacterium]|nr:hypothetical protein [Clostridia bacterium]
SVVENPIKAVVFTPAEPIVIVENTQGDWDTDWEGNEYYRYSTPWFKGGDTLAVTYSETGETVTYTYLYPDGSNPIDRSGFYDVENNYEPIPEQDSVFVSHEGQWELGDNNYMYATYMGNKSGLVNVSIIENPYKGIRYTRAKAPVFIDGNTYHDDWDDRDYYQTPGFENGDILTVIDKYDNETDYVFNDSIFGFLSETNEFIDPGNVGIYTHQHDTPWVLGDENAYYVEYMGFEVTLYASVIENPVKAIEYQAQPQVLIEGCDCYTSYDHGEPYLRYVYPSRELGDSLIIIDKEDNRHVYTLVDDEVNGGCYIDAETGDIIQPGDVNVFDEQYQKPWHLGDDNEYYVEYLGHRVTLYASIIENPVVSISFEPLNPSVVYEVADVNWYDSENDTTYYFEPDFEVGDKLTVVETSGETTVYTAERDERNDIVFAADGKAPIMSWQDIWTGSEQYQGEYWHVGDDNVYFVEYMGRRCYLACELRLNPVGSIEFIPANPAVYVEGTHCYYDFWDDINYYEIPNFEEGDVLRVTYNDATVGTVDYTAEYDLKTDSIRFVSESGDVIETRENKYLRLESNQSIEQWGVGDNTYNVKYLGAYAPVTVRIISLGYTSLEYVPAGGTPQVYECYSHPVYDEEGHEYREYAIPDFCEGDVIRLYKEEGGYDDYVLVFNTEDGERYFVGENYTFHEYEVYRDCDQIANPWTIGGDNYFDIELFALKARVRVELIDTDVACVDFIKESPVIEECTGGEYLRDFNGELFYFYNVPSAEPGDIIRVTYKDNSVVDYVVKHDYDEALGIDTWYAASGDGRELTDDDAKIFDRQYDEHWVPGKENKIYVLVHGVEAYINVIINHCFIDYVDEKYLVSEADGEKPAVFYYSCLHCGEASENTFEFGGSSSHGGDYTGGDEPTDHDHNLYEGWASNSICHWHVCTLCAHQIEREIHTASDWIIDADATAQAEGHKHIECTVCGYVLAEEVIPRIAAYIPGDINNDGDVNNKDLTRLFQYLSEW